MSKRLKKIVRNAVLILLLTIVGFTGLKVGNTSRISKAESTTKIEQVIAAKEIENIQEKQELLLLRALEAPFPGILPFQLSMHQSPILELYSP